MRFNPRACVRRDLLLGLVIPATLGFNPRACVRRDFLRETPTVIVIVFQSTRLREARHCPLDCGFLLLMFQSTRLREARRDIPLELPLPYPVSIHAPA